MARLNKEGYIARSVMRDSPEESEHHEIYLVPASRQINIQRVYVPKEYVNRKVRFKMELVNP